MAAKGIEDLEELHARFLDQEPERIGNAKWTFERFMSHVNHEAPALYRKFALPLVDALEATDQETAALYLVWGRDITEGMPEAPRRA